MELLACVLVIPVLLLTWIAISPRSWWRTMGAWQYKYPEANEPSDTGYEVQRVSAVIGLVVLIIMGCVLWGVLKDVKPGGDRPDRDQQERDYQECLDEHADDEESLDAWCGGMSPPPEIP